MSFSSAINEYREKAKGAIARILVWGPGDPGSNASSDKVKAYQKRLDIQSSLQSVFPLAEVLFSEDPKLMTATANITGQLKKQALQAKAAHVVISLDISRGADLELDHFIPTYPWFRDKVYVFLPEQYVATKGIVQVILDYLTEGQILGFTDQEFQVCIVAKEMAVNVAYTAIIDLMLRGDL